jgi:FMN phosphatase YigB (HAD superfamily)
MLAHRETGIGGLLDPIVTSAEEGMKKPDPRIYEVV